MAPALDPLLYVRKPVAPLPSPPPLPELSSLPASIPKQGLQALKALNKHVEKRGKEKEGEDLLKNDQDQSVWLVVGTKNVGTKGKHMPFVIPLEHPVLKPPRTHQVCLIVKDPQREYKDLLKSKEIGFISRVVGIAKLKGQSSSHSFFEILAHIVGDDGCIGKFKPYEARRELMKEFDRFLVDDRVVEMMPKLLGKAWIENTSKRPIPVRITNPSILKATLERACSCTVLTLSKGTCHTIRLGSFSLHTPEQLHANLLSVLPHVAHRVIGGWRNVQTLQVKGEKTISLPIWNCEIGGEEGRFWDWSEAIEGEGKKRRREEVEGEKGELELERLEWKKEHGEDEDDVDDDEDENEKGEEEKEEEEMVMRPKKKRKVENGKEGKVDGKKKKGEKKVKDTKSLEKVEKKKKGKKV